MVCIETAWNDPPPSTKPPSRGLLIWARANDDWAVVSPRSGPSTFPPFAPFARMRDAPVPDMIPLSMERIQHALTDARKQAFLEELAAHGIVARAARAASPNAAGYCVSTFRDARNRDPEFLAAWDEAMEEARGAVECELHRRAVEGWEEPIYGGKYKERIVGTTRRYSDRLLELRAKALLPEYREHRKVEMAGSLETRQKPTIGLDRLPPELRSQVRELLEQVRDADYVLGLEASADATAELDTASDDRATVSRPEAQQ